MRFCALLTLVPLLVAADIQAPSTPEALFDQQKLWSIHLKFTAAQWQAMEPKGGPGAGGAGPRGFMRGPGGPGPAMFLVPAFLKGDRNHDGKLSEEEFRALGEDWFRQWDSARQGKVTEQELRTGLASISVPDGAFPGPPGDIGPEPRPGRGGMQGQNGRNGMSALMGIDFQYVHADLDFAGAIFKDVAVRYKGNSTFAMSRGSLKRSMKVDLNKFIKGQKLAGQTKINFHSNVTDAGWMNEPVSYQLFREGSVPAPRTGYTRVYLTVPGKYDHKYLGLYSIVEEVDKRFAQSRFGRGDGAILKPSTRNLFADLGSDWSKYQQIYDPKTELTDGQKQRVIALAKLVSHASDADFATQLPTFLNVDEFARYLAVNVWLANTDSILSMGQNFFLYLHPATNKFQIIPWDLDLSFGGMGGGADLSIEHPWRGQNRFLERLWRVEVFKKAYLAHMEEFNRSIFRPQRLAKIVDETAAVIRPAVREESDAQLTRFDQVVAGQPLASGFGPEGGPRGFGRPGGGSPIKVFVANRVQSVESQLAGKSTGRSNTGFGPPGMGGGPAGRPDGPIGFVAPALFQKLDENKDGVLTQEEFRRGWSQMFQQWGGSNGALTEEQVRNGIGRDFGVPAGRMPDFGPPPMP
ncbi:MAG: CotH kinase family protein [Bryobacteraceae bacterium]